MPCVCVVYTIPAVESIMTSFCGGEGVASAKREAQAQILDMLQT